MTLWLDNDSDVLGAACGYAGTTIGGLRSVPVTQTPYVQAKAYCGASPDLFVNGTECGACYRLSHGSGAGVVVQVVTANSMENSTLNCHSSVYRAISGGANVGAVRVRYEPVACDTSHKGPIATMVSGNDYYSKLIFANLPYPLKTAELVDGKRHVQMSRIADTAQWSAEHGLIGSDTVGFKLTTSHGEELTLAGCFADLPSAPGTSCPTSTVASSAPSRLRGTSGL